MKRIIIALLGVLLSSTFVFSGVTGKIAGKIVDARTKEPLVGANITIEGTFLGASADADGDYYIINIPVGTYTLVVSYVGYETRRHEGVRVILDQTTKVDFPLGESIAEGETIVVIAETFKVQKDETSKKITIQAEDVQAMPVKDFSELVAAQAGVIQIESSIQGISGFEDRGIEEIHVRGGRSGEIGYTIDGMYILNPFYGSKYTGTELNDFTIEQVDIKTGVFDAEYGGAMSSMINIITRDGGDQISGQVRLMTSNLGTIGNLLNEDINPESNPNLTFQQQDYLRDYREITGGIGGPVPFTNNKVRFLSTGHKRSKAYSVYKFDDQVYNSGEPVDSENNTFLNKLDTIAGWHQMGFYHSWDIYNKLSWRINNAMKVNMSFWNIENVFRSANLANIAYQYYENGRNIVTQSSDRQTLTFNHQVSKNTFYDVRFSRFFQKMFIGVTDDGSKDGRYLNPDEYDRPNLDDDYDNNPFWYEYYVNGHDRYYHTNFAETYEGFVDLLSQLTKHHQLKAGASYRQHTIMIDEIQLPWLVIPYAEKYTRHPEEASLYIQDMMEYDYMTIRLGLRLEMLNAHDVYWVDPWEPWNLDSPNLTKEISNSKWEYNLSPRLGFSHVITDNATFTFGYGQFTQTPTYRNKYINPISSADTTRDVKTYSPLVGNANLIMEHVTAYEFGLNVGISDNTIIQLIGWSKEYSDLSSTERVPQFPYSFTTTLNTDYSTARGVDVVIRHNGVNYRMELQYTNSRATANRKDPWEGYRETDTPRTMPKREILMSYDRTHDLSFSYFHMFPKKAGIDLFGIKPFERTKINVMFLARSGEPYTPIVGNVAGETNSERGPWNLTANLNYRKFFNVFGMDVVFGVLVQNLFDWKNPIDIYATTGKADNPGARINELIGLGYYSRTLWDEPYRYSRRRQVDFSLEFQF